MKNKLIMAGYIILGCVLGLFIFLYYQEKADRLSAEEKFLHDKKIELREQRDKSLHTIDSVLTILSKVSDSLRLEEKNIKYKPYEKLRYTDRNVDAALDTIAKYHFDSDPSQ